MFYSTSRKSKCELRQQWAISLLGKFHGGHLAQGVSWLGEIPSAWSEGKCIDKACKSTYGSCRYGPKGPDGLESILVGGDLLTEGNSRNLQWTFAEGESVEDRLEGLVFKFEHWHAIRNLFEVSEVKCLTSNFNQGSTVLTANSC